MIVSSFGGREISSSRICQLAATGLSVRFSFMGKVSSCMNRSKAPIPARIFMWVCSGLRFDVERCPMYAYRISGLRSDVGRCMRNVCMLDVFVLLAHVCICKIPDYGPMSGNAQGMFVCFRISVWCRAGPDECLYVYVMWLSYVYLLICLYVYRALLDAERGPMPNIFQCRAGPTLCLYVIICMVCGSFRKLTKLHDYSF